MIMDKNTLKDITKLKFDTILTEIWIENTQLKIKIVYGTFGMRMDN